MKMIFMEPTRPDLLLNKTFFFFSFSVIIVKAVGPGRIPLRERVKRSCFIQFAVSVVCAQLKVSRHCRVIGLILRSSAYGLTQCGKKTSLSRRKTAYLALNFQPPCSDSASCWLPAPTDALVVG